MPIDLISCKELSIGYGKKTISSSIQFVLQSGSCWGLIGANGAGKTTFIRTLLGILKPLKGSISRKEGLRVGYVKQRDTLNVTYPFTVFEMVLMGRYGQYSLLRKPASKDLQLVEKSLQETGIFHLKQTPVRELSGGQKQRVLIARALASEPDLLILDEPTNDMDLVGEEAVLELIQNIHRNTGTSVLLISHLLPVVLRIAEHILFFQNQSIHSLSKKDFVSQNHLTQLYQVPVRVIEYPGSRYAILMESKDASAISSL
ncbi:MAG: metal ABC transporter ATP-binding protein [Planctomycetota bacterium]